VGFAVALVVTTLGENRLLQAMLGVNALVSVTYHLYGNNWLPQQSDTLADYVELTLTGYAPVAVPAQSWTVTQDTLGGAVATAAAILWSITQAGPVYGYYVTDPANSVVLWAEVIPGGPYNFLADGSTFSLSPSFSAD
jgi:hypothetical protein